MHRTRSSAAALTAAAITVLLAWPASAAPADDLDVVTSAHTQLVGRLSNERLEDGALRVDVGRLVVTVHESPADGVSITKPGIAQLDVRLPFADSASAGTDAGRGAVGFDNRNGSRTLVAVADDGSVSIHSIIDRPDAPTEYAYDLALPAGAVIEETESGEMLILDRDGASLFFVAAPWAVDASGAAVPTRYEVRDQQLIQLVDHIGAAYPVVADPTIGGFYMASYSWLVSYTQLRLHPTLAGGTFNPALVATYGWPEVTGTSGISGRTNASMHQQFLCHTVGNAALYASGTPWDLESWRGTVSDPFTMFGSFCNW